MSQETAQETIHGTNSVPVIQTVNLRKTYMQGERPLEVLKGLSLTVEPGEFTAIMGPSGSGKSTLLNMIGALDRPTSGEIFINGVDLSGLNDNQVAALRNKEIGFIFQFFNLIPRMDAQSNVELPMAIDGVPRGIRKERAQEILEMVGLGDLEPSETATVSYRMLAGGSISAGQYPVTVTLTYTDSKGVAGSLTETVTIMVDALIDFEFLDETTVVVYAGEQREMEADLLLVGTDSVQFVSVQMVEDDAFKRVQGSTEYIGAVDPDSPIPFDIDYRVADDAEPGIHDMTLMVQYRDHLNRVHEETLEYTVTVGQGANPSTNTEQKRGGILGWLSRLFG